MGKRIDSDTVEKIVSLFKVDMSDSEIAGELNVSVSYVNKLRNAYKKHEENEEKEKSDEDKNYVIAVDTSSLDDIQILELKINSLKQTLKWYEELIEFKKEKIKKA